MFRYVTTPIYYVNDKPHIGHFFTGIFADVLSRILCMSGCKVRMQTGNDEHGNKVQKAALSFKYQDNMEGYMSFCNDISAQFKSMMVASNLSACYESFGSGRDFYFNLDKLNSLDDSLLFSGKKNYIRTTEGRNSKTGEYRSGDISDQAGRHIKSVRKLWATLSKNGFIYKSKYCGWYSIRDEAYYDESEIIDSKAPTGSPVEWREEEAYFFKLSAFQEILAYFYEKSKNLQPRLSKAKTSEIISFLSGVRYEDFKNDFGFKDSNLSDLCLSRSGLQWGIPVPDDESHAIYVWLDALQNYRSALLEDYDDFWQNIDQKSKKIHVIGKDIIRFHAIYWPAFLLAESFNIDQIASIRKKLVKNEKIDINASLECDLDNFFPSLYVHGWWLNDGEKISKSIGNVINPDTEINFIKSNLAHLNLELGCYSLNDISLDYFRYFLIKTMPFEQDGNYSRARLLDIVNSDLVNNYGNLCNRVFNIVFKNAETGRSFAENIKKEVALSVLSEDGFIVQSIIDYIRLIDEDLPNNSISDLIDFALKSSDLQNKFIEKNKPWELVKQDKNRLYYVLFVSMVRIFQISLTIRSFVPHIAESILDYMCVPYEKRNFLSLSDSSAIDVIMECTKQGIGLFSDFKNEKMSDNQIKPYPMIPKMIPS